MSNVKNTQINPYPIFYKAAHAHTKKNEYGFNTEVHNEEFKSDINNVDQPCAPSKTRAPSITEFDPNKSRLINFDILQQDHNLPPVNIPKLIATITVVAAILVSFCFIL